MCSRASEDTAAPGEKDEAQILAISLSYGL